MSMCHEIQCPLLKDDKCSIYVCGHMDFVTRQGYCPRIDKYADPQKQAEYEKRKVTKKKINPLKGSKRNG